MVQWLWPMSRDHTSPHVGQNEHHLQVVFPRAYLKIGVD